MVNGNLPDGWEWSTVNEIAHFIRGVSYKKGDASETPKKGFLPILRATNIQGDRLITNEDLVFVPEKYVKPEQFLKVGDVVVCMSSGSKHLVGKTAQLERDWRGSFGTFCGGLRFKTNVNSKFGAYYFQSPYYREFIRKKSSGININNLRFADFESLEIPLAPLPEQERIVSRIEELFSDLEAGVAALERVRVGLRRYKASMLKAAVGGKLVNGNLGSEEGELPKGWQGTTVGEIGSITGGITKNSKRNALPKKLPYLRVANVYANELALDDVAEIGVQESEIKRALLQKGDLLVVEGNGSVDQIGRVAIWNGSISPCLHQNHIIKVRFDPPEIAEFVLYWLLSKDGRDQITRVASSTSGLYTLSLSKVSSLPVPLPPLDEQRRIVAEVERRLSVVGEVESAVEAGLVRAGRLRQSVLRSAFEGQLS
jgi:type I restriction enzyme S subunit